MTRAFLKKLSLRAPQNWVTKSGRKRRVPRSWNCPCAIIPSPQRAEEGARRAVAGGWRGASPGGAVLVEAPPRPSSPRRERGRYRVAARSLLHRRHDVFSAGADARRPARHDGLHAGEEADAFGPVHEMVAEERALPAAEAVEGHRHRDRHVDADHADLDAAREVPRRIAVTRKDRRAIAIGVLVDDLRRVVVIGRTHDREDGPEDFLLVYRHLGRHFVEEAAAEEEPLLVALELQPADR